MVATLEQLESLLEPNGQALLARLGDEPLPVQDILKLGATLRRSYPPELVAAAFTLHELRLRAEGKFTNARAMYFTRAGFEQASSERSAAHRATRFAHVPHVADLCCGIGGDLIAIAGRTQVLGVDLDPLHARMAALNADVAGVGSRVTVQIDRAEEISLSGIEAVFVDPARRTERGRLGSNSTEPSLAFCFGLAETIPAVGIKAAPGIDHELVPEGWEQEFVAEDRDLKEAVLWSPALATASRRATLLPSMESMVPVPGDRIEIRDPGRYVHDPNPAITRAGLVEDLARTIGAWKIDDQIAFLSSDHQPVNPWLRTLEIIDSMPWHLRQIGTRLRELDIGVIDIRRRGLPGDVEEIRKKLKLQGNRRATLAMTRLRDQPWCLICVDPQ